MNFAGSSLALALICATLVAGTASTAFARLVLEEDPAHRELLEAMRRAVGAPAPAAAAGASGESCGGARQSATRPLSTDTGWFADENRLDDHPLVSGRVPTDRRAFCGRSETDMLEDLTNDTHYEAKMAFSNPPGDFKTGLCWLHSRFQRNAQYLADYHPELPKPTDDQARALIARIAAGESVVRIPGYANLYDFSKAYEGMITRRLNIMGTECVANTRCFNRAGDSSTTDAATMQSRMDRMFQRFTAHREVQFARIKCSNFDVFTSHSLLIGDITAKHRLPSAENPMQATAITGYTFTVLDPNSPMFNRRIEYNYGDTSLAYTWDNAPVRMMMYPEYDDDLPRLRRVAAGYCSRQPE